jgi:hypothetical protein
MDAPKGRYRVEERDRRLVVIDTATGAPASPVSPAPMPRSGPAGAPGSAARPAGLIDRYGRLLLRLVVKSWDSEGRAIVRWEWEQNGRKQSWEAALGPSEQRRLGRALAAITAFPIVVLLSIFGGSGPWLLLPLALPATMWGVWAINRLQRETGSGG